MSKALEVIGRLYDIQDQIKDQSSKEKHGVRTAQAEPILTAFHDWLKGIKPEVQAKGHLDKAIQYTLNQWDSLMYYVHNGEGAIDNNATPQKEPKKKIE